MFLCLLHEFHSQLSRHSAVRNEGAKLAGDLGLPKEMVTRIIKRVSVDLEEISRSDDIDPGPIIRRAADELARLDVHSHPVEDSIMSLYLDELPNRDYEALRRFKQGMNCGRIAAAMGTDVDSVQRSLAQTYVGLRIRLSDGDASPGRNGGRGAKPQSSLVRRLFAGRRND